MKIEEQKKAVRAGYDMDIIPVRPCHLRLGSKKIIAGLAEPERENVFNDIYRCKLRRYKTKARQ